MNYRTRIHSGRALAALALCFITASFAFAASVPTAEVAEGPYYPFNPNNTLPSIDAANRDNDLTRITGASKPAQGTPFLLSGAVRDLAGQPLEGVKIELWQTDDNGVYYHSGDSKVAKRDRNFQFYGESVTGKDGSYSFRTVKPGLYSGRRSEEHTSELQSL